ncbi:MAG: HAD family phosphatase, partial [Clostridia bacterium]|nr:HAD family phosphatase [Clostridia bacterium]
MKAVITDLDRTLLRTDKSISGYTADVLKKCRERGILVMTASARPLRDVRDYRKQVPFDAVTATNGAVVELPDR